MKPIKLFLITAISLFVGVMMYAQASVPNVPSFQRDYVKHLVDPGDDSEHTKEIVYDRGIKPDRSLSDNLRGLLYPSAQNDSGIIWKYIRTIGVAIFFVFLVSIGIQFLVNASDEAKLSEAKKHLMWLLYGAFLYFGAVWILGTALSLTTPGGSGALVSNFQNNLRFQLLAFFKAISFFAAIIALVIAGYKVMHAMGQEEQLKSAKTGIVNVLIALVLMKVIDFIYLISMDDGLFSEAKLLIAKISRMLGYGVGIAILGSIFVAGYLYITDGGNGENAKKAGKIFQTVFIISLTIFLFLLIFYQIVDQFT